MCRQLIEKLRNESIINDSNEDEFIRRYKYIFELSKQHPSFLELLKNLDTNEQKRLDFITEFNIIYQIHNELSSNEDFVEMEYEPTKNNGSPDLKIINNGVTYWVQIKRHNRMKVDNITYKVIKKLDELLSTIQIGLFYRLDYSSELKFGEAEKVFEFIEGKKDNIKYDVSLKYLFKDGRFIVISFFKPNKMQLLHLTKGIATGTVRMVSDEIKEHLSGAIRKALKSIDWKNDEKNINLIIADVNHEYHPIDIGNVIFGTESVEYTKYGRRFVRKGDGLNQDKDVKDKLSGYILIKQEDYFDIYSKYLFIVDNDCKDKVSQLMDVECVYVNDTYIESLY